MPESFLRVLESEAGPFGISAERAGGDWKLAFGDKRRQVSPDFYDFDRRFRT